VQDCLFLIAELTFSVPSPTALAHVILRGYGIMPDEPKPDFDFQWEFSFPEMLEGSVNTITTEVSVHRLHRKLAMFCPFPNWFIPDRSQSHSAQHIAQLSHLILQLSRQPSSEV
jgi:hypothetical protein